MVNLSNGAAKRGRRLSEQRKSEWLSWGYYAKKTEKYKIEEQNENKQVILDSY